MAEGESKSGSGITRSFSGGGRAAPGGTHLANRARQVWVCSDVLGGDQAAVEEEVHAGVDVQGVCGGTQEPLHPRPSSLAGAEAPKCPCREAREPSRRSPPRKGHQHPPSCPLLPPLALPSLLGKSASRSCPGSSRTFAILTAMASTSSLAGPKRSQSSRSPSALWLLTRSVETGGGGRRRGVSGSFLGPLQASGALHSGLSGPPAEPTTQI